jgi:hypothetical protein
VFRALPHHDYVALAGIGGNGVKDHIVRHATSPHGQITSCLWHTLQSSLLQSLSAHSNVERQEYMAVTLQLPPQPPPGRQRAVPGGLAGASLIA